MTQVKLRHKEFEGLTFGPDGDIQFGIRGGFAPFETVIDSDHPLFELLWAQEGPRLSVVEDGPARIYISPIDSSEHKSRQSLLAHVRVAAKNGSALARLWLDENGSERDRQVLADQQERSSRARRPIEAGDVTSAPPAPVIVDPGLPPSHPLEG